MTVTEAWNRGNNLLATGILGLSAFAFLPELFIEDEWQHKIDEGLLFWLGVAAITWYLKGENRFMRSVVPVIMVWVAFAIKIVAVVIEHADKEDVGDDFGAFVLFLLGGILVTWLFIKSKKLLEK